MLMLWPWNGLPSTSSVAWVQHRLTRGGLAEGTSAVLVVYGLEPVDRRVDSQRATSHSNTANKGTYAYVMKRE
jgi:hypothetical protein